MNFVQQIDERDFIYHIAILTKGGGYLPLAASAVHNLEIEDSILNPFHYGSAVIANYQNCIEVSDSRYNPTPPSFAGNNYDILYVQIMPQISDSLESDYNDEAKRKTFMLNFYFSIIEIDDIIGSSASVDLIKLTLKDVTQQVLHDSHSYFHSSQLITNGDPNKLNNSQRALNTGTIMKEFLKKVYQTDDIIDKQFDEGATKIIFTSLIDASAYEDLTFLVDLHQGEQNRDPCTLTLERDTSKFSLTPLSKLFELQNSNPEKYVLETFRIPRPSPSDSSVSPSVPAGLGLDKYSNILSWKLVPFSGKSISKYVRNNIYNCGVSMDRNIFISQQTGSIDAVQSFYDQHFVEPMKGLYGGSVSSSIDLTSLIGNPSVKTKTVNGVLSPNMEPILTRGNVLQSLLFSGNGIVFKSLGYTHRCAGRFIDITSDSDINGTELANKLFGRWLVVNVKHVFAGNSYFNHIEAVRPYNLNLV